MSTRKLFKWKRVAIDFDGTLVEQISNDQYNTDDYFGNDWLIPAKSGAAETTAWLKSQGFEILIYTCRPDYQRKYMESILDKAHISYDYILFYTKPLVDLYIDDKGFRFTDWSTTQTWLEQHLEAPFNSPAAIGMEPQGDFEDLLRAEKARWTLHDGEGLVLDVGCGSGRLWEVCEPNLVPKRLYGIEPDEDLRTLANSSDKFRHVYNARDGLIINNATVDLITLFGVLEHVDKPLNLLEEYSGITSIVATVPNANSFHRRVGVEARMIDSITELGPQDIKIGHKRVYTYDKFHKLMIEFATKHNYKISKFGSCGFKMTTSSEMIQFADRWDAINLTAQTSGLIGPYARRGAELFCRMEKK